MEFGMKPPFSPGGNLMGTVVIKCNVTGKDFSVGIQTDEFSFKALPDLRLKARCPHCGSQHEWTPREARLIEGPPLGEPEIRRDRSAPSNSDNKNQLSFDCSSVVRLDFSSRRMLGEPRPIAYSFGVATRE